MARTKLQLSLHPSSIHILALLSGTALDRRSSNFVLTTTVIFLIFVLAISNAEHSATLLFVHSRLAALRHILLLADHLPFFWQHHHAPQQLGHVCLLVCLLVAIGDLQRRLAVFITRLQVQV